MKLYCLSGQPSKPCFILKFKQTTIMLDCGLDATSVLHYLPLELVPSQRFQRLRNWQQKAELKEVGSQVFIDGEPEFSLPELRLLDLSEVDVILISNHHCMLALPYITQHTGFKGQVYATEPTLNFGRLLMEELVEYVERCPKLHKATRWKQPDILSTLPLPLRNAVNPNLWRKLYTLDDVSASMSKVKMVGFSEKVDVFGALKVTAVSSGYCIGSCNWVIQSDFEKISYLSGSSTLTTHPKPMDQAALRNSDILVLCGLTQTPTANPDNMIGEFCVNTAMTLRAGGNVLVPCNPSGVTYDLFECLSSHLDSCGLASVPMYFVSPVADSSLAYSNIYAEWLSSAKHSKVYLAEPPFPHAELVKNLRLKHYPSLHEGLNNEMRMPCLVFCGHPSLRFGDVVHFLDLWGKSNTNSIIFTEPDFPYMEALAPYQPLGMKAFFCPIDTSLSFSQANKLIKDLKPQHLVVPEQYTAPPITMPNRTDLVIETQEMSLVTFKRNDVLSLPIKRKHERVEIDADLAATLVPTEVRPGVAVALVSGHLVSRDNKCVLKPMSQEEEDKLDLPASKKPSIVWGKLDVRAFVQGLEQEGIQDAKIEESLTGHIVHLAKEDILIQIEEGSTHIISQGNEPVRVKLRDTLLRCLQRL